MGAFRHAVRKGPRWLLAVAAAVADRCPCCPPTTCTDFEKGFIRAETVAFSDFVTVGGMGPAKEKGLMRLEGKEYVVQEGDVLMFRFAN